MTADGSVLRDDHDGNLVDELRRLNPVDVEELPSSHSPDAMRTLERILDRSSGSEPELEAQLEAEAEDSSPSPAADGRGGGETPPPCPAPH